jgi:uncharacterized glyoxalase superfamily protein PhnB
VNLEVFTRNSVEEIAMTQSPPAGYPVITPYLYYHDVPAAIDFLTTAFGFTERLRTKNADGEISHAEVAFRDAVVMLGCPSPDYHVPPETSHLVHVYVEDVDSHFTRAQAAGAKIIAEPETKPYGDRNYLVEDPEGHQWGFAQHVADVTP